MSSVFPAASSAREIPALVTELADQNPQRAYAAIRTLIQQPQESVEYLGRHLAAIPHQINTREIRELMDRLRNSRFNLRENAQRELIRRVEAEAGIRELIRSIASDLAPDVESQRRLATVLSHRYQPAATDRPRDLTAAERSLIRAVATLEKMALGQAATSPLRQTIVRTLRQWSLGHPISLATWEAQDALARILPK